MKSYLKGNKGFTVKELIFTIVAIIIAFIAGFALSYILKNDSKQYIDKISELENKIQQLQDGQYTEEDSENNDDEEENKGVIEKSNGKVYMLLDAEDTSEYLYDFNFENINEKSDTITATVVRTMTKEPIISMDDEEIQKLEKYTLKDELVIKKVNDSWLVDKYSWVITNH